MLTRVPGAYSQGFFVCPSPEVAHQEYLKPTSAVPTVFQCPLPRSPTDFCLQCVTNAPPVFPPRSPGFGIFGICFDIFLGWINRPFFWGAKKIFS